MVREDLSRKGAKRYRVSRVFFAPLRESLLLKPKKIGNKRAARLHEAGDGSVWKN
jgi:hypothetical protein